DALDDGGNAHAAAHTQGGQAVAQFTAFQFIQQGAEDDGAGGSQRVAHGDGAAVHVHFLVRNGQFFLEAHHHRGKGFVHFKQVDLVHGHARFLQRLAGGGGRAGEHDGGVCAGDRGGDNAGAGLQTQFLALGFAANQHGGGTVDNAGGVAGVVHVIDLFHVVIFFTSHAIEAHFTHHLERRFQAGQGFHGGVAAHMLVAVQNHHAVLVGDRYDGFGEVAFVPGVGGFLLGLYGKAIDIFTSEAFQSGYQVGADT